MDERLYLLLAIMSGITMFNLLEYLNAKETFKNKKAYRIIVSIFTGAFWILFLPALILGYILHECAWHLAEWDFKATWETIKNFVINLFKRK